MGSFMPEITAVTVALLALVLILGVVLGWILRGDRCAREKIAVNAGWQQQIESQQSEHERLARQNKSLMERVNQFQASIKDSTMRAKELSDSLKDTFRRRDDLQRQLKELRGELEVAVAQRDRLQADLRGKAAKDEANEQLIVKKDKKIQRLSTELTNWQSRVPPLVDRYRTRDEEARELENELDEARMERDAACAERDEFRAEQEEIRAELRNARARIAALEQSVASEHTRIEPVDADTLPDGLDASNEPHADTMEGEVTRLRDQIDSELPPEWQGADLSEASVPGAADEDSPWAKVPASGDRDPIDAVGNIFDDIVPDSLDSLESSADEVLLPYLGGNDGAFGESSGLCPTAEDSPDDLKQIKGVGPAIEKTLQDLGFLRFQQIAEMTEYDIDRVARPLKGFRSRIYREDWIGQARMLQLQKSNGPD
jgi:uncharacterized protein YoxC